MKSINLNYIYILFLLMFCFDKTQAQFVFNGQLVQRAEYRNGYGSLKQDSLNAAAFISQRFRLQAAYKNKNINVYGSIQDIRTWGNTSQIKLNDGMLSLHEGWADFKIDSFWSVKVGRQELNYDNARFLGNLDWAMQARAHDFILVKYTNKNSILHLGGGYNQNVENLNGNIYTQTNQYKSAQMIWYHYKKNTFEGSLFFWNNGKQYLAYDSSGKMVIDHSVRFMQTFGIPTLKYTLLKNLFLSAFAYYQTGKDVLNKNVNAYDVSLQFSKSININSLRKTNLSITIGAELISGNKNTTNTHAFSPLYGTNHAHNGYMDYFYVSGRNESKSGLNDIYAKIKFEKEKKWFIYIDAHSFNSNTEISIMNQVQDRKLGVELDLTAGYILNEDVSFQFGYSQMFASSTLKNLQANQAAKNQNWIYLMLIIRPNNDKKFIGILN